LEVGAPYRAIQPSFFCALARDDAMRARARGWALALGLAYVANSRGNSAFGDLGLRTIDAALNENA